MDPKELVMQVVQTLGPEVVVGILTNEQALSMITQFVQAVGQLQPEERQKLAEVVGQMAGQGSGNEEQAAGVNPDEARQQALYGQGGGQGGFTA